MTVLVQVSEVALVVHEFDVSHALLLRLDSHVQVVAAHRLFLLARVILRVHRLKPIFNHFKIA